MEILARGVGRRKEAVAQVQIVKGTGKFIINNIPAQQYLHNNTCSLLSVKAPLTVLTKTNTENLIVKEQSDLSNPDLSQNESSNVLPTVNTSNFLLTDTVENGTFDTIVKVKGGGLVGQADAIKLGLARALCVLTTDVTTVSEDEIRKSLKDKGYLTQDSRIKERRKYGLKKARKATQYNKR